VIASLTKKNEAMQRALDTDRETQMSAKQATFAALRASRERMMDIRTVEEKLRLISLLQVHEVETYVAQMKMRVDAATLRLEQQQDAPRASPTSSSTNSKVSNEAAVDVSAIHQPLLKEFASTFTPSRTSRDDKALRFLLDEYMKQEKIASGLYAAIKQRTVVKMWTGDDGHTHCLTKNPLEMVDASSLSDLVLEGGEVLHVSIIDGKATEKDDGMCREMVAFFGKVLFVKDKAYIRSLVTADRSVNLTIRRAGGGDGEGDGDGNGHDRDSLVAACTFSLAQTLDKSTIVYIDLYHCKPVCRTLRMATGMEYPSMKLLSTCVLACQARRVHVLAQSVGYTYVMSELSGTTSPVITMQEVKGDAGRQFWKKHLDKTHGGFVIGAQLAFTSDMHVYGDCCFLHRCFDLEEP
tara:strand:- start:281 stop:1507 length:1227 start_codon:yes stop_codon:yes gene_type:complete